MYLLDVNVLMGLCYGQHTAHEACRQWFHHTGRQAFSTTAITELGLIRVSMQQSGRNGLRNALQFLESFYQLDGHTFWACDVGYANIAWNGVIGHRQTTDAYLASLARRYEARLITLDKALALVHEDVAELVPHK